MNSRNDKINYLKGLAKGKRSLSELARETFEVFNQLAPASSFFKRMTKGADDNRDYAKEDIEQFKKAHSSAQIMVIIDDTSCAPLLMEKDLIWHEQKTYSDLNLVNL